MNGTDNVARMIDEKVTNPRDRQELLEAIKSITKRKLMKIKYVGVEFDTKKIGNSEDKINVALENGYQPITDYQTPMGLVMVLGLWNED
tara:strand:+ start:9577 stop:9843 length:267 start_codon:yes stop_codon:yes gene_type:complete